MCCDEKLETIDYLVSGCSVLMPNEYKNGHDRVGQYLLWKLWIHYSISTLSNWYEHHHEPVTGGKVSQSYGIFLLTLVVLYKQIILTLLSETKGTVDVSSLRCVYLQTIILHEKCLRH